MKRVYLFLAALVGLTAAIALGGQLRAQAPAGATTPTRQDPPRVAVFNVAQLMKDFSKWQYYAVIMDNERKKASAELIKAKNTLMRLTETLEKETEQAKREQLLRTIREQRNAFEDREKQLKETLDGQMNKHLKELFSDVNAVVSRVAEAYNYDIIFAYPDATNAQEADSQMMIDVKMRPQGAFPFYVNKKVDITGIMLATLNEHRKPPSAPPAPLVLDKDGNLVAGAVAPAGATGTPGASGK